MIYVESPRNGYNPFNWSGIFFIVEDLFRDMYTFIHESYGHEMPTQDTKKYNFRANMKKQMWRQTDNTWICRLMLFLSTNRIICSGLRAALKFSDQGGRRANNLTGGIYNIFQGINFQPNKNIGQIHRSWTGAGLRYVLLLVIILWYLPVWSTAADPASTERMSPSTSLSVSVKPVSASISTGTPGRLLVTYIATGKNNMTVTSRSGEFLLPTGKRIQTHRKPVAMSIVDNNGAVAEAVSIPVDVAALALEAGYDHVIYRRIFNNTVKTDITLKIAQGTTEPLNISKPTLEFKNTRTGEKSPMPTVGLNSNDIIIKADIAYTGSGMLRVRWKVDDQILGYDHRFLKAGADRVSIASPKIPQLPTYDTGRHQVALEILNPRPVFSAPRATYIVSSKIKGTSGGGIQLLSPSHDAYVPLPVGRSEAPVFQWKRNADGSVFQFELYPEGRGPDTAPLIKALTDKGSYTLSSFDAKKLAAETEYTWCVKKIVNGSTVAASLSQSVYFVKKAEGELRFEHLEILQTSEKTDTRKPPLNTPATYDNGPSPQFSVRMGQSLTMRILLKNNTNLTKKNLRVMFLVDDRLVDSSIISRLDPGKSTRVEGRYDVVDNAPHSLKIQATEGKGAHAPVLAFSGGRLVNPAGSRITKKTLKDGEIQIGHFIIRLSDVINNDPMNYSGSGTITFPFLNNKTLNISFRNLKIRNNMVINGNIPVNLQGMGFTSLSLPMGPSELTLNTITFRPDGAECSGHLELVFPFANPYIQDRKLTVDFENLSIRPDKGFSGQLPLSQDCTLKLSDAFGNGEITFFKGSFITLTDNVFSASLTGGVKLPEMAGESYIPFTGFKFESDGGIYGPALLDAQKLTGTEFTLKGGIILDFTTTASPGNFKNNPDWMGVYVQDGTLDVALFDDHFQISARHLSIQNGVNGTLSSSLEKNITAGNPKQFLYRPYNIEIFFRHFTENRGTMTGRISGIITIPYVNLSAETELMITVDGIEPAMTLTKAVPLTLGDTVSLNVRENSTIGFADGVFTARLISDITDLGDLGGKPAPGLWAALVVDSNGNFGLEDPDGRTRTWVGTCNQQTRLYGLFSLGLEKFGFGTRNDELFFGVQGSLSLMKEFDADPEARIRVAIPAGTLKAEDIHVGFEGPEAFSFSGRVNLPENVPWGKGFAGDMPLTVADTFSTPARLIVGHTGDFPYFFIESKTRFSASGIQLTPYPISLYGFNGRAYFNALPAASQENPDGYTPQPGAIGLDGQMTVGTTFDTGYTFYGDLSLNIAADTTTCRATGMNLRGNAGIMSNPQAFQDYRKVYADADFGCLKGSACVFTGRIDMENFPILDPGNPLMAVSSEIDMKLGTDEWYLNMKTEKPPAVIKVLPSYADAYADGSIAIDGNGATCGLGVEMDAAGQAVFPIYNRLRGRLTSDFPVSFSPASISAEFPVWMELAAGLSPDGSDIHDIFQTYTNLSGGLQTPEPNRIQIEGNMTYPVLGGNFMGEWSASFAWGDSPTTMYDPSAAWPCISHVTPPFGAKNVSVASPVTVTLTQPAGADNQLTCEDQSETPYTVGVYVDNVVINKSSFNLSDPVPGRIEWNPARTQFTFYPDDYLVQNTTYYVHVAAHAEGTPELIPGGKWVDRYTTEFTTGPFPKELKPLIKDVYPANGQKHCYTRYPIKVSFKQPMDILGFKHLKGRLFKWDGTEIPGTHRVNKPVTDTVTFTPSNPLAPNTRYVYKLMLLLPPGEGSGGTGTIPENPNHTTDAMSDILLTLSFDTGKYATFKQMMDNSQTVLKVVPLFYPSYEVITEEEYKPSILRCTFNTVEPVRWEDINIEAEPVNKSPTACDWLTPRYCSQDPSCKVPDKVVNRCLTRSAEEKFIHVDEISGQPEPLRHTFDLNIRLGNYRVVPDPQDCPCSIDAWNKKVADRTFIISMAHHIIGDTLHQALLDRSRIVFRHRMSPAAPYVITVDLPAPPEDDEEKKDAYGFAIKTETTKKRSK